MLYKDKKEHGEQKRKTKERNGQKKKGGQKNIRQNTLFPIEGFLCCKYAVKQRKRGQEKIS